MIVNEEKYLARKYSHLADQEGNLIIPDRLQVHKLQDDDFYENVHKYYSTNMETYVSDLELIEYIRFHQPAHAHLIGLLRDSGYRSLPDECKFPLEIIGSDDIKVQYHGPKLSNLNTAQVTHTYGVIIGIHKFCSFYDASEFEYKSYNEFIQETYQKESIDKQITCYNGEPEDYKFFIRDNPAYEIYPVWKNLDAKGVWNFFKEVNLHYSDYNFQRCAYIAKEIDTGKSFCLSFGQFAQIFPFLPQMKFQANGTSFSNAKKPKKWQNSVFVGQMVCSSNFSDEQISNFRNYNNKKLRERNRLTLVDVNCEVSYLVTLDLKHRIVLIRKSGTHCTDCHSYQKFKGYPIMRRLLTEYPKKVLNRNYDYDLLSFYRRDEICLKNKHTFFKPKKSKLLTNASKSDYDLDLYRLMNLIKNKKGQFSC